jgi:hypothetical protein
VAVLNVHHFGGTVPPGAVNIMRGTDFGNPFKIRGAVTRDEVVARYRRYLWWAINQDADLRRKVRELHGLDLCCCCAPKPCHGDVLAAAARWLVENDPPA